MMRRLVAALCVAGVVGAVSVGEEAQAYQVSYLCNDGSGAAWPQLPVRYKINSRGSSRFTFAALQTIIQGSFGAWSQPCCSAFRSQYDGTTSNTAVNKPAGDIVLSWEETRWPTVYGDVHSTIAVTLMSFSSRCTIVDAPILFNGVGFRFTDQCNANGCANNGTDLQSVATHEIGHLLGLDHSNINGTTMYAYNLGGDLGRTLHQDDINGVCALYNQSCGCTTSSQCAAGEQCVSGQCRRPSCTQTGCDVGLVCDASSGDCITPPCSSNAQCGADYQCQSGRCVTRCAVCRDCQQTADCGARAACVDFNEDGAGECVIACNSDGTCPGDSACFEVPYIDENNQRQSVFLCLNPDADQADICPDTYICRDVAPPDPCMNVTCRADQVCQAGRCVTVQPPDMGTPDMSNPPDMTMAPDMMSVPPDMDAPDMMIAQPDLGEPGMEQEEEPVVVIRQEPTSYGEASCGVAPGTRGAGGAVWCVVGALWAVYRRRRLMCGR